MSRKYRELEELNTSKKSVTTKHMLLITRIKKEIISDELNHKYRIHYKKEWVEKFLDTILIRGKYTETEGKILMEIRNLFITELNSYNGW